MNTFLCSFTRCAPALLLAVAAQAQVQAQVQAQIQAQAQSERLGISAAAAQTPPPVAYCPAPLLSVMVTDDPYNTPVEVAEQWRGLKMPAWHTTAHALARRSGCFTLADPDPLLLALPGAPVPGAILRVRPVKLALYEKTLGDKINEGITGYIESYTTWLGAKATEGPPLLSEIGIVISVLCPRERRVERELAAADNAPPDALIGPNREHTGAQQNAQRAERVIAQALDEAARRVARGEGLCPPPAVAMPAAVPAAASSSATGLRVAPALAVPASASFTPATGGAAVSR